VVLSVFIVGYNLDWKRNWGVGVIGGMDSFHKI